MSNQNGINVLSLFDGISCGRVALDRARIKVKNYWSSEIDKYAIQISQKNWPDIKQVGSVVGLKFGEQIDLLIGGSPCQDLSIAKKNRKGLDGERSGLFWEYVRILKEVKPRYFVLENVASMPKEAKEIITKTLGVEPKMINAALVSAQNRKRLFFCGQIRERLYFNDVLCYTCLQDENKGILGKTQNKGTEKILGETPARCCDMQNMPSGILEDKQAWNDKNLLGQMSNREQEAKRLFKGQGGETKVSENISEKEQEKTVGVSKDLSPVGSGKREDENSRCQTSQKNSKCNEDSLSKRADGNKENSDERGSVSDSEYETDMCCVFCHKRLNNRPYRSFVSGWNEQPKQSPSIMSEVQFNEARQNNGRVFDIYQLEITQPEDRGILLKDILLQDTYTEFDKSFALTKSYNGAVLWNSIEKSQRTMVWTKPIKVGFFNKGGQGQRVYSIDGKSVTLSAKGGGWGAKTGLYLIKDYARKLEPIECERLTGLPDNYTDGISKNQRRQVCGTAFNVDVVAHILSFMKL